MMKATAACLAGLVTATGAHAGGIDRSGQRIDILFRDGNYAEIGGSWTSPSLGGRDIAQAPPAFPFPLDTGTRYGDVGDGFTGVTFGIKYDLTERISLALIGGEDFGSDIAYPGDPATSLLGGTTALADSYALTLIGRYRFTENFSVHAGLRGDWAQGEIGLSGLAYGPVNGYDVDLDSDLGYGYLVGAAFELPEYAARVALTYNSAIEHDFDTTETLNGAALGPSGETVVETPQSINLDLQTGIAENTLLFGSVRWQPWSEFEIEPERFTGITGTGLVSLDDSTTYTLGVARRFTPAFVARAAVLYEDGGPDDLVSPLAPRNGFTGIALGGSYRVGDVEFTGGARYLWLGDAKAETGTPDRARARFEDNTALTLALGVGVHF